MPLRPLNIAQTASKADKIEPGSIVEYEQHSKPQLAVALNEKRNKWALLNQGGAELELPGSRLYLLPGKTPDSCSDNNSRAAFLSKLAQDAAELRQSVNLEEIWEVLFNEVSEASISDIVEIAFTKNSAVNHLAVRRALLNDQIFFKRKKFGFEPRPESVIEELKVKARVEREKREKREKTLENIISRLKDPEAPLPSNLESFEQTAVLGKSAAEAKEIRELLEDISQRTKMPLSGTLDKKAFSLLVALGHFSPDENLTPLRLGRPTAFSEEVLEEASKVASNSSWDTSNREDLRHLFTITVDGAETKDFDDALTLEELPSGYRIGIHISDVDTIIQPDSVLEHTALRRGTSIYCPDQQLSMLPEKISEETLSLIENSERPAITFFIEIDKDYQITSRRLCRSVIKISQRVTYEQADTILCSESTTQTDLHKMLLMMWEISNHSEGRRQEHGAIQFSRREMAARLRDNGKISLEPANDDTPARKMVSELMILANETAALFARENKITLAFRSQEAPEVDPATQGDHLPEGPAREYFLRGLLKRSVVSCHAAHHFGLGLEAYTQVTSPIRRAVDLLNQRQLSSFLQTGEPIHTESQFLELLAQTEQGLDEAMQIQRERNRYWLLKYLMQEKITDIEATIVRVDTPRPLAELQIIFSLFPFYPPNRSEKYKANAKDLGRKVRLKIEKIDPRSLMLSLREM